MNNKQGFTLLEVLLALSVLSVGIMAAFTLSLANLNTARDNYQRIRAANLAREGLELARNVRDTNWLKIEANEDCEPLIQCTWDYSLWRDDSGTMYTTSTIAYDADPIFRNMDIVNCFVTGTCRLYEDDNGFYNHDSGGSPTNMARLINVQAICFYDVSDGLVITEDDPDCSELTGESGNQVGLLVTSTVYWEHGNQSHQIEVTEELYNWRAYVDI
ncbi:prepilin-type N-terminal cleavage/methylation domain-containing protein [bacterium]|nr:prepilin-type N-terminal cleavage/methylation domain-containing protein [bacterium]